MLAKMMSFYSWQLRKRHHFGEHDKQTFGPSYFVTALHIVHSYFQADGTWTDVPRCIEHEPGKETQIPGFCPGIPGYCSDDRSGGVCEFDCLIGPDIRSFCTPDGTWEPYPTCDGDIRDTRDGCGAGDGCPGEFGGARNRTAEAAGGKLM